MSVLVNLLGVLWWWLWSCGSEWGARLTRVVCVCPAVCPLSVLRNSCEFVVWSRGWGLPRDNEGRRVGTVTVTVCIVRPLFALDQQIKLPAR